MANAINSAKITGGGQLISDTLVSQTKQTITDAKVEAKEAAANPALDITSAGKALSDAAKTPYVAVSSFNNSTATNAPNPTAVLEAVTNIATSTVKNVDNNGVAPLNNTIANINKTATETQIKNVDTATNNIQAIVVKANDTAAQTVTVVEAVASAVNQTVSNKIDDLGTHLDTLATAATTSIPKVAELGDNVISQAVIVAPAKNVDVNLSKDIKDVIATNTVATTSSTATSATNIITAAEPVVITTNTKPTDAKTTGTCTPSYNGESLQLGFGYDFKLCNGICNTQDSYLYQKTRDIGGKYIFRCHCKADFSVWFFRENADRFTACPENDLGKCYLHYFGSSYVDTVAKDSCGKIANPDLNDVIKRILDVDERINNEELDRCKKSKSFLKPTKADEFVSSCFKPKSSCS